jgi:hypothetical protein
MIVPSRSRKTAGLQVVSGRLSVVWVSESLQRRGRADVYGDVWTGSA